MVWRSARRIVSALLGMGGDGECWAVKLSYWQEYQFFIFATACAFRLTPAPLIWSFIRSGSTAFLAPEVG